VPPENSQIDSMKEHVLSSSTLLTDGALVVADDVVEFIDGAELSVHLVRETGRRV